MIADPAPRPKKKKSKKAVVHVLWEAATLCEFSRGPTFRVPRDWPDDHFWMYPWDKRDQTCPGCVAAVPALEARLRRAGKWPMP